MDWGKISAVLKGHESRKLQAEPWCDCVEKLLWQEMFASRLSKCKKMYCEELSEGFFLADRAEIN